ncbi:MAG: hypothetical protein IPG54_11755 [Sphingomonadales bacterium]|jgi:hypothetical protein|nr:hypothetical protein [Sphingomonadales bacterium]MBK9004370.1 hypothetical protein [Sphingomonadales bacterium]MBK9269547.1 hypothetical protein [Sphingomonadales bacterium]MBP6434348.1 hypothetical protein [Sphingorhabdus sp.]
MRKLHLVSTAALVISMAMPAYAQTAPQADEDTGYNDEIGSRPSRWCNFGCGRGPSSGGFGGDV